MGEDSNKCGICNGTGDGLVSDVCSWCDGKGRTNLPDKKASFDRAFRTGWSVVKGMFENPGGFGAGDCTLCGEPFNGDNPSYESKEGNAFCKGCFRDRWRVE